MITQHPTPEEAFIWHCARNWRQPIVPAGADLLNWEQIVVIAINNRMSTLLDRYLTETGLLPCLPAGVAQTLQAAAAKLTHASHFLSEALQTYLHHAAAQSQSVAVIKGLWVAQEIYGQANLRPGNDIDLLLPREEIEAACTILENQMGYGRWWRPLLDDEFYLRHHLHAQRCNLGRGIWFELHWAFDHPYTLFTIDYPAIFRRTSPGRLFGEPIRVLSLPDLLLSLIIHLVKHAIYLPTIYSRPELPRLIIADKMLMYFVDVAEVVKQYQSQINWPIVIDLAAQWGVLNMLVPVLTVCQTYLDTPLPEGLLEKLPRPRPGIITRYLMNNLADHLLAIANGHEPGRGWQTIISYKESVIFRPIRLLDFAHYLLPNKDYLNRRYQSAAGRHRLAHLGLAARQYSQVAADTLYFSWRRYRRIQALTAGQLAIFDARFDPE